MDSVSIRQKILVRYTRLDCLENRDLTRTRMNINGLLTYAFIFIKHDVSMNIFRYYRVPLSDRFRHFTYNRSENDDVSIFL